MKKDLKLYAISWQFVIGIVLSIFGTLVNIWIPLIVIQLIDGKETIINHVSLNLTIIVCVFIILSAIIGSFSEYLLSVSGDLKVANVRIRVEKHLLTLPMSFFYNKKSGQLSSRIVNDAEVIQNFMTNSIPTTINSVITILGSLFILFNLDGRLTLFILFSFSLVIFIAIPIGKISEKLSIITQKKISELSGQTTENIYNIRNIKLNNAYKYILDEFNENILNLFKISKKTDFIFSIIGPIQTVFTLSVILMIVIYGGIRVQQSSLTIGTLVSFLIYLFQVIEPVNVLANFYTDYKQARGATYELNNILKTSGEENVYVKRQKICLPKNHSIYLKNASFSYDNKLVLENISMKFASGMKTAIVGPSGAGKTTIINLLTRLYELKKGILLLADKNANNFQLGAWRNLFAVVTQENSIISGTLYLNLTFGLSYKPSKGEIWSALKKANLYDEIKNMPEGLYTIVGEQGVGLSGGQKQRLQLARAYLKKAPFLILDEATSNLDPESEKVITSALKKIMNGHHTTLIVIAHRLSTIVDSDKIYFLDNHHVVGRGNHSELMRTLPKYKKFVEEQFISTK
ncbi:MAG: ABC transporter ATP-binding protein/permease [Lactobacillus sp.]|nr:ABC transporter ATP-binding protein/permease [Lactobacillus sp.]